MYRNVLQEKIANNGRNVFTTDDLFSIVSQFKQIHKIPEDPFEQLKLLIISAYSNWFQPEAIEFRETNMNIDDFSNGGVAVIIQTVIHGGFGRVHSRSPSGQRKLCGEFQSVTSSVMSPIKQFQSSDPTYFDQLVETVYSLESSYRDMQTVEFVLDDEGKFWSKFFFKVSLCKCL